VHWYDAKAVVERRARRLASMTSTRISRETVAPPWGKDHEVAMTAAIVAGRFHRIGDGQYQR
jgi:hypothetical protein